MSMTSTADASCHRPAPLGMGRMNWAEPGALPSAPAPYAPRCCDALGVSCCCSCAARDWNDAWCCSDRAASCSRGEAELPGWKGDCPDGLRRWRDSLPGVVSPSSCSGSDAAGDSDSGICCSASPPKGE